MKKCIILLAIAAGLLHGFRGFEKDTLLLWNTNNKVTEYPDSVKFVNDEPNDLELISIEEIFTQHPFSISLGLSFEEQFATFFSFKDSIWDTAYFNSPLDSAPTVKDSFWVTADFEQPVLANFSYHPLADNQVVRKFSFKFLVLDENPDSTFFMDTLYLESDHYYVLERISSTESINKSGFGDGNSGLHIDLLGRKPTGQNALPKQFRTVPLRLPE